MAFTAHPHRIRTRRWWNSPGGAAPFDPANIGGLLLWLAPESLPAVSAPVTDWPDSTGNFTVAQAVGSEQPVVENGLDGNKSALFDLSDDLLIAPQLEATGGNLTLLMVFRQDTTPVGLQPIMQLAPSGTQGKWAFFNTDRLVTTFTNAATTAGSSSTCIGTGVLATNWYVVETRASLVFTAASDLETVVDNGTPITPSPDDSNTHFKVDQIGPDGGEGGYSLSELFVVNSAFTTGNSALTAAERAGLYGYLADKYPSLGL